MDDITHIEIDVKANHKELHYVLPPDLDIWEMGEVLRVVLTFLTYSPELIDELMPMEEE